MGVIKTTLNAYLVKLRFDQVSTIQTNIEGAGMFDFFGLFNDDHNQNQIDQLETQLEEHQEKYNELDGVVTPEAEQAREDIANNIHDIKVQIERIMEQQRLQQEQDAEGKPRGLDRFND